MGRVKIGAKYYDVPLFLAPLTFTRDSRENENYPRSQSREDGSTGFYKFVSLRVRKFQKGDRTSNVRNANTRRYHLCTAR